MSERVIAAVLDEPVDDLMTYVASLSPDARWHVEQAMVKIKTALRYAQLKDEIDAGRLTIAFNGPQRET